MTSRLLLGLPNGLFHSDFQTKILYAFFFYQIVLHAASILFSFILPP